MRIINFFTKSRFLPVINLYRFIMKYESFILCTIHVILFSIVVSTTTCYWRWFLVAPLVVVLVPVFSVHVHVFYYSFIYLFENNKIKFHSPYLLSYDCPVIIFTLCVQSGIVSLGTLCNCCHRFSTTLVFCMSLWRYYIWVTLWVSANPDIHVYFLKSKEYSLTSN